MTTLPGTNSRKIITGCQVVPFKSIFAIEKLQYFVAQQPGWLVAQNRVVRRVRPFPEILYKPVPLWIEMNIPDQLKEVGFCIYPPTLEGSLEQCPHPVFLPVEGHGIRLKKLFQVIGDNKMVFCRMFFDAYQQVKMIVEQAVGVDVEYREQILPDPLEKEPVVFWCSEE